MSQSKIGKIVVKGSREAGSSGRRGGVGGSLEMRDTEAWMDAAVNDP